MIKEAIKPVHPFPARMAPELVWRELPDYRLGRLRVLDPMAGSGTTLVTAKLRGHEAVGFDRDPLAVLIARSWLTDANISKVEIEAAKILSKARRQARMVKLSKAYPRAADGETKEFVRYWFDKKNRVELAALSDVISKLSDSKLRNLMWCAFSRLIITKKIGVSLAMDVSHSRPHRTYDTAPINTLDSFDRAVKQVIKSVSFWNGRLESMPASVNLADARKLPIADDSVDMVITSPPYLNAIDYVRGHKFTLIWMGYSISDLRDLRSTNVGTEASGQAILDDATRRVMKQMCKLDELSKKDTGMLGQYVRDMRSVLSEVKRVLRKGAKAVFVVGDCNIRKTFVRNSECIKALARELDMGVKRSRSRALPENRRYLPPPSSSRSGNALKKRMREEVIITLIK